MRQKPSRSLLVTLSLAMFSLLALTQPIASAQKKNAPTEATRTVTGCLTGLDGRYTLGTDRDDLYVLKADDAMLRPYKSKTVRVTGTLTPSEKDKSNADALSYQPPSLTVQTIKKVQDNCN